MTTVLLAGRRLPHQDWEGDDWVPGSFGKYVTCTDTASGRDLAFATNGRVNVSGQVIRSAVEPDDHDGITLSQAKQAIERLTDTTLVIPTGWRWPEVIHHLRLQRGLVIQGWYSAIPSDYRFQTAADFGHAMFVSHYSPTAGVRDWDPLDRNRTHHGQWIPATYIRAFMEELARREGVASLFCAYVPLEPLKEAAP